MKRFSILLGLILVLSLSGLVTAHDTWLLPDLFAVSPKTNVTLQMTSGMAFPTLDTGPKRERVGTAKCRLAGKVFDIVDISEGPQALVFIAELPDAGVAVGWVKLQSKTLELKSAEVEEYLDEIGAPASVRTQWAGMVPQRWRETYTKHSKTFVRVGNPDADRSWSQPVGMALEIVPEEDPTTLREGDEFPVRVLKNGAPCAGFPVNAVREGQGKGETRQTDASGRVVFVLEKAGRWLVRGTEVRKVQRVDADWESDFTTLTLEVR